MNNILVINNDMDTMTLLKSWLEKRSYKVKFTGKKEDVPVLMKEFKPDLVLVDILQSAVIEQVKEYAGGNVPVLLMTGYTLRSGNHKVTGYDDTIEKPFNLHLLEKKIERLIHTGRLKKAV